MCCTIHGVRVSVVHLMYGRDIEGKEGRRRRAIDTFLFAQFA